MKILLYFLTDLISIRYTNIYNLSISIYISFYLSNYLFTYITIYLSIGLFIYFSIIKSMAKNTFLNLLWQNIFFLVVVFMPVSNLSVYKFIFEFWILIYNECTCEFHLPTYFLYGLFSLPSLMYVHVFCNDNFFYLFLFENVFPFIHLL